MLVKSEDSKYDFIKIINFLLLIVVIFSLFISLLGSVTDQGKELKLLLSIVFPLGILSLIGSGFIILPLHIYQNFKGTGLENQMLAWSIILTTLLLFLVWLFFMRYASMRHSGFSDDDIFLGWLNSLFL